MSVKSKETRMIEKKWPGCLIVRSNGKSFAIVEELHEVGARNGKPLTARRWSVFQVRLSRWMDGTEDISAALVVSGIKLRRDAIAAAHADAVS